MTAPFTPLPYDHPLVGRVFAKDWVIGTDITLDGDTTIGSETNPVQELRLGSHIYIGEGCRVWSPKLSIGDYTKIHNHTLVYGRNEILIGHNCWVGQHSILDGEGGLTLEDNVGVGAHSQIWSHIRHGDILYGCKYFNFGYTRLKKDSWCVGHVVVSPVTVEERSVVLVGSVLTKDTEPNHVYGGSPAKDLTDRLGPPFAETTPLQRYEVMLAKLLLFEYTNPKFKDQIEIVVSYYPTDSWKTQFNVTDRTYSKISSEPEIAFMKFLLPEAKFTPR